MATITHSIQDVCEALRRGNLAAIPTETVYGLAGDVFNDIAVEQIFVMKKRPFFDPLIVHVASVEQAKSVVSAWPDTAAILAKAFWPGPLTMVLPKAPAISDLVTSGLPSVGVRMPKHPMTLEVIEKLGKPIAAPSANQFKKSSPTTAEHVVDEFPQTDLLILDGGPSDVGLESTVIGIHESDSHCEIEIYRLGAVTERDIRKVLGDVKITQKSSAAAPGQLGHHYMPKIPLVIFKDRAQVDDSAIQKKLTFKTYVDLELNPNPVIAARELYAKLRECSRSQREFIRVFRDQGQGDQLWDAIWDRLTRAATFDFSK